MFEVRAQQGGFSLGEDVLDRLRNEKQKDWACPKPNNFHLVAHATCALRLAAGSWAQLRTAYLALLAEPRTYLHKALA